MLWQPPAEGALRKESRRYMSQPTPKPIRRSPRAIAIMLVSLVVYTALDLWSKEWALDNLSQERPG